MKLLHTCLIFACGLVCAADEADPVIGSIGGVELREREVLESLGGLGTMENNSVAQITLTNMVGWDEKTEAACAAR